MHDYLNYGNLLGPARVYMYMYVKLGRHLTCYCRNVGWARLSQRRDEDANMCVGEGLRQGIQVNPMLVH